MPEHKIIIYDFSDRDTCNEIIVKKESDIINGYCFESVIEVETSKFPDIPIPINDLDEIRTYVYDICQESFTTKKKVANHITESHGNQKCTKKPVIGNTPR